MIAGRLKYRLEILKPEYKAGRMTTAKVTYTSLRVIAAERISADGSRSEENGEHFPDFRARYNVRDAHPVSENWRVRELGGYLYTVVGVVPNRDRGYKTLICERVNE